MLSSWTAAALWLLPACLVALVILAGAMWTLRRQRNCPSCRTPMRTIGGAGAHDSPDATGVVPTYEVLVCDGCSNAATMVHGHQSRFAYCPSCLNRSMRAPCMRLDDGSVQIEEKCELCGYADSRIVTEAKPEIIAEQRLGQVIPFPMHRVRPSETHKADNG